MSTKYTLAANPGVSPPSTSSPHENDQSPQSDRISKMATDMYIVVNDFFYDADRVDRIVTWAFNLAVINLSTLALVAILIFGGSLYIVRIHIFYIFLMNLTDAS